MSGKASLSLHVPNGMDPDELEALKCAVNAAFIGFDDNGEFPTYKYIGGIDDGTDTALQTAEATEGPDLLVVYTTLAGDQNRTEQLLERKLGNDMIVYVTPNGVSHDGFADALDNKHAKAAQIDVISLSDLSSQSIAHAEVGPWHDALPA